MAPGFKRTGGRGRRAGGGVEEVVAGAGEAELPGAGVAAAGMAAGAPLVSSAARRPRFPDRTRIPMTAQADG